MLFKVEPVTESKQKFILPPLSLILSFIIREARQDSRVVWPTTVKKEFEVMSTRSLFVQMIVPQRPQNFVPGG